MLLVDMLAAHSLHIPQAVHYTRALLGSLGPCKIQQELAHCYHTVAASWMI